MRVFLGLVLLIVAALPKPLLAEEKRDGVLHNWDGDIVAACLTAEIIESGVGHATLPRLRDAIICERVVAFYLGQHCPQNNNFSGAVHEVGQFRGQPGNVETTLARALKKFCKAGGKQIVIEGTIRSYECGDNCYLTVVDSAEKEHSGLCAASLCRSWNKAAAMPKSFIGKRVRVTIEKGNQYDAAGNIRGAFDAFSQIRLLQ
jgi:hypothetical protein